MAAVERADFSAELGRFVSKELGLDVRDSNSKCVFCRAPYRQSRLTTSGKCEIKVLHCLHSICGCCLEESLLLRQEVMCPICDARSGEQDYHKYLCNFAEHQGIDFRAMKDEREIVCDECVESCPANMYCTVCVRSLCQECANHHRRSKATATHGLVTLRDQEEHSMHRAAFCPLHTDQAVEFFCETCSIMCCRKCILSEHEHHVYKLPGGGLVDRHRQQLRDQMGQLRDLAGSLQARHREFTRTLQAFDRELDRSMECIDSLQAQVKATLEERCHVLLREIDAFGVWHQGIFDRKRAQLNTMMVSQWHAIQFVEKVLAGGSKFEVLFLKGFVSAKQLGDDCMALSAAERAAANARVSWHGDVADVREKIGAMADVLFRSRSGGAGIFRTHSSPVLDLPTAPMNSPARAMAQPRSRPDLQARGYSPKSGWGSATSSVSPAALPSVPGDRPEAGGGDVADSASDVPGGRSQQESPPSLQLPAAAEAPSGPRPISLHEAVDTRREGRVTLALASSLRTSEPATRSPRQLLPAFVEERVHGRSDEQLAKLGLGPPRSSFGTEGECPGMFQSPCGLALDRTRIYIADTLNHRIQVFDKGTYALLGQVDIPCNSEVAQLQDPSGLCCIEEGTIIVVEYGLDRVLSLRLASDSLEVTDVRMLSDKSLYGPFGVGFSQGRIIVADSCNHRCVALNAAGETLFEFGGRGCGAGLFEYPECLAVFSDGYIAVSDKDNHRVQVFDGDGGFCHYIPSNWTTSEVSWTSRDPPQGRLRGPMGMVCDMRDRLYVCDCGGNRIQIFTRSGQWLWSSCSAGVSFRSPTAIQIDERGEVYVASDHCVQVF